jgi:hypothetical protein
MSEPENFITRWSRRKREAAEGAEVTKSSIAPDAAAESAPPSEDPRQERDALPASGGAPQPLEAAFDPAKLPPIETITAESDIRAFLAPGVPPELTRAALRRVWSADPNIRDFIGLSENSWDFNAPGAMAGFGPLEMTEELRRQVVRIVGRDLAGDPTDPAGPIAAEPQGKCSSAEISTKSTATAAEAPAQQAQSSAPTPQDESTEKHNERHNSDELPQRSKAAIAPQQSPGNSDNDQLIARRPHGRALPK